MPKAIRKSLKDLSLVSKKAKKPKKTTPRPEYLDEDWVYGYHLKNRHIRLLAEKYGLPWQTSPMRTMFRITGHLRLGSKVPFKLRAICYRGGPAQIITFVEDDGRKRLELNECTEKQMEKVRRMMGLPKGCKPKWFDCSDNYENAEFSSDDESFPPMNVTFTKIHPEDTIVARRPDEGQSGSETSDKSSDESTDEDEDEESDSDESSDEDEESDSDECSDEDEESDDVSDEE